MKPHKRSPIPHTVYRKSFGLLKDRCLSLGPFIYYERTFSYIHVCGPSLYNAGPAKIISTVVIAS